MATGQRRGSLWMVVVLVLVLATFLQDASAFSAKKHEKYEPTRPAFKAPAPGKQSKSKEVAVESSSSSPPPPCAAAAAASPPNTLAFAPAMAYTAVHYSQQQAAAAAYYAPAQDDYLDDDTMVIGYTTAIISCTLSLALGFGLGYGT
jgi:hypothetical protein